MTKTPNILIVDDDNLIALMLKDTLVENGYTVHVAPNGPEGLDILRREKIDLVLVDWVMPKMNGLEVCKIIKGSPETRLISVIMVSSQTDVQDVKTALDAGVDDYIRKPVNMVELVARVRSSLRIRELHIENLQAHQEKLELRENLTSMIIHDLKNPLSTIKSVLELWESEEIFCEDKELGCQLDLLKHATGTITEMVLEQLDLSRLEAGRYRIHQEIVDLNEIVRLIYLGHRHEFGPSLKFGYVTEPAPFPQLFLDKELVRRIITNLFSNAIRHTSQGFVKIIVRHDILSGLTVSVSDSGVGIKKEEIPRLFDKFYQAENSKKSTGACGIGLHFCDFAVKAMGGTISVASVPGRGSDFTFTIPAEKGEETCGDYDSSAGLHDEKSAREEMSVVQQESMPVAALLPPNPVRVLLADDSSTLRKIMTMFLNKFGISEIDEVRNGKLAVEKVAEKPYDIVFFDISMPVMNGLEAAKIVRSRSPDTKIIMLTAEHMKRKEGESIGVASYLTKPFTIQDIRNCLRELDIL